MHFNFFSLFIVVWYRFRCVPNTHSLQNNAPIMLLKVFILWSIVSQFDICLPSVAATPILSKFPGPTRHFQVLGHWFCLLSPPRAKLHSGFGKQTGGSAACERVCEFEFVCLWIWRKKPGLRCSMCAVSLPRSFLYSSTGIITPFYKVVDVITLALYIKML